MTLDLKIKEQTKNEFKILNSLTADAPKKTCEHPKTIGQI